jgi:hypothetical protein
MMREDGLGCVFRCYLDVVSRECCYWVEVFVYIAVSYNLPARCTVMASVIISIKSLVIAWCMVED